MYTLNIVYIYTLYIYKLKYRYMQIIIYIYIYVKYMYVYIYTMCALFLRNNNGLSPGGCANMYFFLTAWRKKNRKQTCNEKIIEKM